MLRPLYFDGVEQGGPIPTLSGRREQFLVYPHQPEELGLRKWLIKRLSLQSRTRPNYLARGFRHYIVRTTRN
jgi:hypothetical protein